MKKTDLIHKLKQLQGISDDERAYLINLVNTKKKYGLVWEDKPEVVEEQLRENLPVLKEVNDRAIINGEEYPNHILIEGDNLHALTALTFTHEGKIDVIYIDPPYNTGNKDFKYNDTFVDKEDSYRHSKWLSFMCKRLRIAKRLLNNKGILFISIDDNEQSQLKLLCDEILGENNFIGAIVWFKKRKGSFLSNQLVSLTEYILPYRKNEPVQLFGGKPDNTESQPIIKRTNSKKTLLFPANLVKTKLKDGIYEKGVYGDGTSASVLIDDFKVKDGLIINEFSIEAPFVWSQEFLNSEINNGTEILINTLNLQVRVIRTNNESIKAMPSFLDGREIGATNEDAYELLKSLFNTDRPFSYSKPVNLVKKVVESATYFNKNAIIFDFFAGSGTTLHATMELNAEDGGNRQCILITNNENNICEEVTYERNKRVIQGYTNAKGEKVEGLSENNLRYYKSEFVSREPSVKNKKEITRLATELLCIKEDCYTLSEHDFKRLQDGQDLSAVEIRSAFKKHMKLFESNGSRLLVIYDDAAIEAAIEIIKYLHNYGNHTHPENPVQTKVYVFSNGQYPYTEEFEEVLPYITLCALPDAIYKAYQNVLPKRQRQQVPELEEPTAEEVEKSLEHDVKDVQDKQDKKQGNLFNT